MKKYFFLLLLAIICFQYINSRCPIPCNKEEQHLCGSDGNTYLNECELRKKACSIKKAIVAVRSGKCLKNDFKCLNQCGRMMKPVCGSDGKVYANECLMIMKNCEKNKTVSTTLKNNMNNDKDLCKDCKWSCPQNVTIVCGSDNMTYDNECELNKHACKTRTAIIVVHYGKCLD
nr:thrombin inhibitor rhodniin-like [Hydra vulgaris]